MKKILFSLITLVVLVSHIQAQNYSKEEPKNNLGYNLEQLKAKFPNLKYWSTRMGHIEYKAGDNMMFQLIDNKVVTEFMLVDGVSGFPNEWYKSAVAAFLNTNYKTYYNGDSFYQFFYSKFQITIFYSINDNTASITYEILNKNTGNVQSAKTESPSNEVKFYGSEVEVYGSSPIYGLPDLESNVVCYASNGKVKLISKSNGNFYLVDYNGKKGYLSSTWIKK